MKKVKLIYLFLLFFGLALNAQVGIGTLTPTMTVEVVGSPATTTVADGLTLPRITGDQLATKNTTAGVYDVPQAGTLIYVTVAATTPSLATKTENVTSPGVYIWSGTTWEGSNVKFTGSSHKDVGYIVAWPTRTSPPDFLLPISGGTYNKADYPELIALHGTNFIEVFASETGTTFTLKDLNNGSFLKGGAPASVGTSAGATGASIVLTQANLPNITFSGSTASTSHTHTLTWPDNSYVTRESPGGNNTTFSSNVSVGEPMVAGDWARRFTVNATDATHNHTFITTSINPGAQTSISTVEPLNTTVLWVLKAKSTSTSNGDLTFNNATVGGVGSVTTVEILNTTIEPQDMGVGVGNIGDFKHSMRNTDHEGWVLLNGRSCNDITLTATQRATCAAQTFPGNNLPQTSGGGQNTATYLADRDGNAATRGSIGGNTDNIWGTADLPQHTHNLNPDPTGTSGDGNHNHGVDGYWFGGGLSYNNGGPQRINSNNFGTNGVGNHAHVVDPPNTGSNAGNGLVAATVSTMPRTLDTNTFIYLGT